MATAARACRKALAVHRLSLLFIPRLCAGVIASAAAPLCAPIRVGKSEVVARIRMSLWAVGFGRLSRTPAILSSIAEPNAFSALPIFVSPRDGYFMALCAMGLTPQCLRPSALVLFMSDRLKMAWVYTRRVAAFRFVVYLKSIWDRAYPKLVSVAMGYDFLPATVSHHGEVTVSPFLLTAKPRPARIGIISTANHINESLGFRTPYGAMKCWTCHIGQFTTDGRHYGL